MTIELLLFLIFYQLNDKQLAPYQDQRRLKPHRPLANARLRRNKTPNSRHRTSQ